MASGDFVLGPVRTRFNDLVGNMSPRDRKLFGGLVVAMLLFVVGGMGWVAKGFLADLRARVDEHERSLAMIEGLADDYRKDSDDIGKIEEQLRKSGNQELSSFVEKAAGKIGIGENLKGVRERTAKTEGNLEEKSYNVDLDKVSLEQLTNFLYEIEATGYPLRIRSTRVRASGPPGSRVLTVTLELSAFRLVEEGAAPPAETP